MSNSTAMAQTSFFDHTLGGFMSVVSVTMREEGEDFVIAQTKQEITQFSGMMSDRVNEEGDGFHSRLQHVYKEFRSRLSRHGRKGAFDSTVIGESGVGRIGRVGLSDLSKQAYVIFQQTMTESIQLTSVKTENEKENVSLHSSMISLTSADSIQKLLWKLTQLPHKMSSSAQGNSNAMLYVHALPRGLIGDLNALAYATGGLYRFCQFLCHYLGTTQNAVLYCENEGQILSVSKPGSRNQCQVVLRQDWPNVSLRKGGVKRTKAKEEEKRKQDRTDEAGSPAPHGKEGSAAASSTSPHATDTILSSLRGMGSQGTQPQEITTQVGGSSSQPPSRGGEATGTKNIYLLGETGEGKSTLANALTESESFKVSHSGTGTMNMSAKQVQIPGDNQSVLIWDTPGMNDQNGMDSAFQKGLLKKIQENGTVSAVVLVSKDGVRVPGSLIQSISSYRESFGESFMRGLCVCIGINKEKADPAKLDKKRSLWVRHSMAVLKYNLPRERIFFYNATDEDYQPELDRFKKWLIETEAHLIGVGQTIYHGLSQIRDVGPSTEAKSNVQLASEETLRALRMQVSSNEVKKVEFDSRGKYGEGLYISLKSTNSATRVGLIEIGITSSGRGALELLQSVKWKTRVMGVTKKERLLNFLKQLDSNTLAFVEKSRKVMPDKRSQIVQVHFILWDMSSGFPEELSRTVDAALSASRLAK